MMCFHPIPLLLRVKADRGDTGTKGPSPVSVTGSAQDAKEGPSQMKETLMASMAISGTTLSSVAPNAAPAKSAPAQTEPAERSSALKPDSVKLSQAGMAKLMHQQGQTI